MTGKEAKEFTGRSRYWLANHRCQWCGQTLWNALLYGCGAIYAKCDPTQRAAAEARKGKQ